MSKSKSVIDAAPVTAVPGAGEIFARYTKEDLRAIWDFDQRDFERFIDTLVWLDKLSSASREEQLKAARHIFRKKHGIPAEGAAATPAASNNEA